MTHDKGPSIHNLGSGDTQSHEPISHRRTLGCSPQRTVATALVMSGAGPARFTGGFLSRAGLHPCVAGADLALLGGDLDHAGAGLVAGTVPRQLVGACLEEPRHLHPDHSDSVVGNPLGSAVRRRVGSEPAVRPK